VPNCECHSFALLEAHTLPILSHADIVELVVISGLELISSVKHRTDEERRDVHNRLMKLQEDFLGKIGQRVQEYEKRIRSQCLKSLRDWNRYE
jgi:hypothetical protein